MKRREFITLVVGGTAAWPIAARAQRLPLPAKPVIGLLSTRAETDDPYFVAAIYRGLKETGFVVGQNVSVEPRFAANKYDRLPQLAAELVQAHVAAIVTMGTAAAPPAKAATSTIPVIFGMGDDPEKLGLVDSLNRPGGNVTGATVLGEELGPKRLEFLSALVPAAKTVAVLLNPTSSSMPIISKGLEAASRRLDVKLEFFDASNDEQIDEVFTKMVGHRLSALLVINDAFFNSRAQRFADLATLHRIPGMYPYRIYAEAGGLMSYGASIAELYRQVGIYAGRVLKGERPAELPVLQPSKFDLVINIKAAKALDLVVPPPLLARADDVIE
jgi:putative tryptophan/tyrosine transport system substrate-binding protein